MNDSFSVNRTIKTLAQAGVFLALAVLLEFSTAFIPGMPQGGKFVSLAMLPVIIFSLLNGPRWGGVMGIAFGLVNFSVDRFVVNPLQFFLDYILAFFLVGFTAGLFYKDIKNGKIYIAITAACLCRFLAHFLSGLLFVGYFAPTVKNPMLYSLSYNAAYMVPTFVVCIILIPLILKRFNTREKSNE